MDLNSQEERERIAQALEQLDPECMELFQRILQEGESLKKIAERSDASEDDIKHDHRRCWEKLRELLR